MPHRNRKNPFTTGNPYTGTARSQRALLILTGVSLVMLVLIVAVLIVAPSIRSLFRVRGLPVHDLSGSCELSAPGRHTRPRAAQSTDKAASASVKFWPAPIPVPVQAGRVFRRVRERDTYIACHRCQFRHTRASDSSGRDYS